MTAILAFFMSNWWRTAFIGVLAAGLSAYGIQTWRLGNAQVESAELKVSLEKERADAAEALAAFEAAAREKERHLAEQAAEAADKVAKDFRNAEQTAKRTIDDLAAGNLKLRREWLACESAAKLPEAPASAGNPDAGADDRAGLAAAIVRAGAECAATVRGLQGLLRAERESMADTQAE